jgi:Protein of unknown function (DUF4058)
MPLLDHFHPPLHPIRHWESFHSRWATAIADALDRTLPPRYFAEVQVRFASDVEAEVFEFGVQCFMLRADDSTGDGLTAHWAPPPSQMEVSAVFPDDVEVPVRDKEDGERILAVIALISPGNKDRDETRRAFAAKCSTYLQRDLGLIIVDIVTDQTADLHNELVRLLGHDDDLALSLESSLYAVAYHPRYWLSRQQIEMWPKVLAVGEYLPTLPLALRGTGFVPVDLEATYTDARQRCRL